MFCGAGPSWLITFGCVDLKAFNVCSHYVVSGVKASREENVHQREVRKERSEILNECLLLGVYCHFHLFLYIFRLLVDI